MISSYVHLPLIRTHMGEPRFLMADSNPMQ